MQHPLFQHITSLEALQIYLEHNVFAVWDVMSLIKSLQKNLTCTQSPWVPVGNAGSRYFINEVVLGMESDVDDQNNRASQFELYLKAMLQLGSKTHHINQIIEDIRIGLPAHQALRKIGLPPVASSFADNTFTLIHAGKMHIQAAVFIFCRESLIPDNFILNVNEINRMTGNKASQFSWYLSRHMESDWAHYSYMGYDLVSQLCGENQHKWNEVEVAVCNTLERRISLYNSILNELPQLSSEEQKVNIF
jgi:hypothetical protein